MCDLFPEVSGCCICISLRIGMLFISVLGIMTGVVGLSACVHHSNVNYNDLYKSIKDIKKLDDVMKRSIELVNAGVSAFSACFMFTGLILLFGALFDSEGLTQVFVWLTFLNILFGLNMVLLVSVECVAKTTCFLSSMDWLSGSMVIVLVVGYLILWLYFVTVANSYVVGVY